MLLRCLRPRRASQHSHEAEQGCRISKKHGTPGSHIFQILIVIDDFADDSSFTRNSHLLHSLYTRGRHSFISTITSTQVYKAISPIIRKNITHLFVFKLRNQTELNALLEEFSALFDSKTLMKMYKMATEEPHSFLYINLMSKQKNKMMYVRFDHVLEVEEVEHDD